MFFYESLYAEPFARYTPVVAATPEGSEIVDDWEIFWGLAKRLNLQLVYDGVPLDMTAEPTTDALLAVVARHAPVSFEELRSEEHTSELQSLMRISYAVFCLKKKKKE